MSKVNREERERIKRKLDKPCPACGNKDVIRIPGSGLSFYYCSKCSSKAQQKAEKQYKNQSLHQHGYK